MPIVSKTVEVNRDEATILSIVAVVADSARLEQVGERDACTLDDDFHSKSS